MPANPPQSIDTFIVDAFTSEPFRGNPAGVCSLRETVPDAVCRSIAAEFNLSETAFVLPVDADRETPLYSLRWFTPTTEVDLCGHATLATAKVLFEEHHRHLASLSFETRSGRLSAHRDGAAVRIDLPANRPDACSPPPAILAALGIDRPVGAGKVSGGLPMVLLELRDEAAVRAVDPDFRALYSASDGAAADGVIITARGGSPFDDNAVPDFVSRFFAPRVGVDEDPVTGAAHTVLGPYWASRLGRETLLAHQVSKRGGRLVVTVAGGRVLLTGEAVIVLRGQLLG
jgi:PhzF family phenazine biosynthesis protein